MHARNRTWPLGQSPEERCRQRILPIEGGDGSTLTLDFTTGVLDPRLTFTRSSTATYIGADGLVKTMAAAPTNDPTKARFDHDPTTLAPRGLLIEGQSQNLFTYSENFNDSLWQKVGSTIDTTSVTGPDGVAATTRRVKENSSSDQHGLRRQFTCAANTTYTVSVFIKKGSYDSFVFEFWGGASFNAKAVYSTIDGNTAPTLTSASGVNPSVTKTSFPQTGWHRYTLTFTNPNATGTLADFNVLLKESNAYLGNGTNYMDVYGFSLELGAGASSYIPTGISQGTRNQDQMQMTDLASIGFNTSAGTLTINGTYNKDANSAAYPRSIRFMGTSVQSMAMITSGKTLFGNTPNTSGGSYFEASRTLASAGAFKFGWTLTTAVNPALASATVSLNGSSTSITPLGQGAIVNPTSLQFLYGAGAATDYPSMNISSLKYWPYATTAADLNARTSL